MNVSTDDISNKGSVQRVSWVNMAQGEQGDRIKFSDYADRSIQVTGVFGGATLSIQGSNDNGLTWATLSDPQGNALDFLAAKIEVVTELTQFLRPIVVGGDGTTDLNVHLVARKAQ